LSSHIRNMDIRALENLSDPCTLCPRNCRAHRKSGKLGRCDIGYDPVISQWGLHFGEEDCLVAGSGSGTVFFSGCNLLCIFCQNYTISHEHEGRPIAIDKLASVFLDLEKQGAANINLVTPTHFSHAIAKAIDSARKSGLSLPIVYNCGGYEKVETLRALEGAIDIYMPDIKTLDEDFARKTMDAPDYPSVVKAAIREMHRQVGDLKITEGRAVKGLLVRHLVMPGQTEDSKHCLDFLHELSSNTAVNVMSQYHPMYQAYTCPEISRRPADEEIIAVKEYAETLPLRLL